MRILIVEDELSLAELVSNRLKKEKYIVDICNDGDNTNSNINLNGYKLYGNGKLLNKLTKKD